MKNLRQYRVRIYWHDGGADLLWIDARSEGSAMLKATTLAIKYSEATKRPLHAQYAPELIDMKVLPTV